ncbi:MAG: diguanylate cyclase [Cyanobacteria bacterium J06626_14]
MILNNTGWKDAKVIGQRLCNLMANQTFAVEDQLDLSITISAGTSSLIDSDDEKGISLLRRADQYLLKAKSQGRNQVLSAEEHKEHSHSA